MTVDILKRFGWFLLFLLVQVVVLGRIHLFGVATPMLYVYFVIQFPRNHPKLASLLWAFALGLLIDIFYNTPGLTAFSLTALAAVQPYYLELFLSHDAAEDLKPSVRTIGMTKYSYFVIPLVFVYHILFFSLDQFCFFHMMHWLLCVVGSTAITLLLIYTFEIAKQK